MKKLFALGWVCAAFVGLSARATTAEANAKIAAEADTFLATLDASQRTSVLFDFKDPEQRKKWSNLPSGIFKRAGLRTGDLTAKQRDSMMAMLASALSPAGYQKMIDIVVGDQVLKDSSGSPPGLTFGTNEFFVSILGKPSPTAPWMIQFGGHHLALNITLAGDKGVLTPSLTAAQPATYVLNGKVVRPLGPEVDKAVELIISLDANQRAQATLGSKFRDLVMGPTYEGPAIAPEGVKASTFNGLQRKLLFELIYNWVGIIHPDAAAAKMEEIKANLASTWFAWSGPTNSGSPAYFRIQGPTLVIEYAPQNLGGVPTNHIHTIYRDPTDDYGKKFATP